jgi:hypothetical protein
MARRPFTRIGAVLPSVLRDLGLQKRFSERKLVERWPDVVGPELARRARAMRFERGTLFVHVEKELVRKLRAACPDVDLVRIRFGAKEME